MQVGLDETTLYIQNLGATNTTDPITFYDEEGGYYCQMEKVIAPGSAGSIWLAGLDNSVCVP